MGCDIHPIIERQQKWARSDGEVYMRRWQNAGTPDLGRNYELFAALAGVRNRDGIEPLASPRGLPGVTGFYEGEPLCFRGETAEQPCEEFEALYARWHGDAHSMSWTTLAEVKAYDTSQVVNDGAVITSRDESGRVLSTARSVFAEGRNQTAEMERVGQRRIFTWPGDTDDDPTSWDLLIDEMERAKRPGDIDDDIRLVFFFDN